MRILIFSALICGAVHSGGEAKAEAICLGSGPQSPRDISLSAGENPVGFAPAPPAAELNLCNIHLHRPAEHKGPGYAAAAEGGGFQCAAADGLSEERRAPLSGAFGGVTPGQTLEAHWVYTSCDADPGEGLGACVPEGCDEPVFRVEAQVFLVVNDPGALDFATFGLSEAAPGGRSQPRSLPDRETPIEYSGSTTGPSYSAEVCSPYQVTWSVRPGCLELDIASLHRWAQRNAFAETAAHGVRALVSAPELLAPID